MCVKGESLLYLTINFVHLRSMKIITSIEKKGKLIYTTER